MGYETYVDGWLTITPPLPEMWLHEHGFDGHHEQIWRDVTVTNHSDETVDLGEDGMPTVRGTSYSTVEPACDEAYKAYDIEEHVGLLAAEAIRRGATIEGYLRGIGEEDDDRWKLVVDENGTAQRLRPTRIVWSDGSEEEWG